MMSPTSIPVVNTLPPVHSGRHSRTTLLLVDDQIMVCKMMRRILANEDDIDFHICTNSSDVFSIIKKIQPTIILQDLKMSGVDGLTLVKMYRYQQTTKNIPVIVLSSCEDTMTKKAAFQAGANDYLVKWPDAVELIARIRYQAGVYANWREHYAAYQALRESQQKLLEENLTLQRLTYLDSLTRLANRRYFEQYFDAEWKYAMREGTELSLLMIDVDDFKRYNDTYGHLSGDKVLKQIAKAIQNHARRPTDLAARLGGEEFAIILPATPKDRIVSLAKVLQEAIYQLNISHDASSTDQRITISVGCATIVPKQQYTKAQLIEMADKALYVAKNTGKNRVEIMKEGFCSH